MLQIMVNYNFDEYSYENYEIVREDLPNHLQIDSDDDYLDDDDFFDDIAHSPITIDELLCDEELPDSDSDSSPVDWRQVHENCNDLSDIEDSDLYRSPHQNVTDQTIDNMVQEIMKLSDNVYDQLSTAIYNRDINNQMFIQQIINNIGLIDNMSVERIAHRLMGNDIENDITEDQGSSCSDSSNNSGYSPTRSSTRVRKSTRDTIYRDYIVDFVMKYSRK